MEAVAITIDITPTKNLATSCYGPRNVTSERITGRFEANVLMLRDEARIIVVVSIDWFFVSPTIRKTILQRCSGLLLEESLIIAASHAHTSPNTDVSKVGFSTVDQDYVAGVEDNLADGIFNLLKSGSWTHVNLRFALQTCDYSLHRRRKIWWPGKTGLRRRMSVYPNPRGDRDRELRLLRVEREDGTLLAVTWGISCHPTEWPNYRELSPDYPGIVREALRQDTGQAIPVLFLQGFCGDLRPPATGYWLKRGSLRVRFFMLLCSLLNGRCFAGFSLNQYRRWVEGLSTNAAKALKDAAMVPALKSGISARRSAIALSEIGVDGEPGYLSIHTLEIGSHLSLVAVSAEVVWSYASMLREINPGKDVWPVGYTDHCFGYLPNQAMIAEGGYEVTEFKPLFGVTGDFSNNLEEVVRACFESHSV